MDWTVVWLPDAESELADLWIQSSDRSALTAAADQIDRLLRREPASLGESRPGGRRILIVSPLAVFYRVLPNDRLVQIGHVRDIKSRKK